MADWFRFQVSTEEIAAQLHTIGSQISGQVTTMVRGLSLLTHGFIIDKAQKELTGYNREAFLGENNDNVHWVQISDGIWVVEIDESAAWVENGRPAVSMATEEWLLKNAKTAKDGSKFKVIPFTQSQGKGKSANFKNPLPELEKMVKDTLASKGIDLKKVENDSLGNPKLGIIHKVKMETPDQGQHPDLFSAPRSQEMADLTGLKPHGGIFYGKGLVVTQQKGPRGGIIKSAVTFRVVSSKHALEGRWMAPAVTPFNSIEAAYKWAQGQWEKMVKELESGL